MRESMPPVNSNYPLPTGQLPPVISYGSNDTNIPTFQEFLSSIRQIGLARKDRFVANIPLPSGLAGITEIPSTQPRWLSMLCEDITLPGKVITARNLRINALNEKRAANVDYSGETISFTFLVDFKYNVRDFFDAWLQFIGGYEIATPFLNMPMYNVNDYNLSNRSVAFYDDYTSSIVLTVLNPNPSTLVPDKEAYSLELHEAWPTAIHAQTFSFGDKDIQRLTVDFVFKYWSANAINSTLDSPDADPQFVGVPVGGPPWLSLNGLTSVLEVPHITLPPNLSIPFIP